MVVGEGVLILEDVFIRDNYVWFEGGGISVGSKTDLRNCTNVFITNNRSDLWGGGIAMDAHSDSAVFLANVVVANNSAGNGGGGIYFGNQRPVLNNVTIINNHCPNRGGGIFGRNSPQFTLRPILINCIVWNNDSSQIEIENGDITITHSDIQDSVNGVILDNSTLNWLDGNIGADPLFADSANGDYTLTQNSPCIDAGTSFFEWDGQVWLNLPAAAYHGAAPDMGAFEFDPNVFIEIPRHVSTKFKLYQNYPNPFNSSTAIEYSSSTSGAVSLAIYDLLGKRIRILVNGRQTAGHYMVRWNGINESGNPVASGVYLYRLKINDNPVLSKRMILVK
jgi:predicted outer membrane repeat protein